jgi:hypothetical protein
MRNLVLLASIAAVVVLASASAASPGRAPRAVVEPTIARLGQRSTIAVSGFGARSVQVRMDGATYQDGKLLPWRSLRLSGGVWRGKLPFPALRGVYQILVRAGSRAASIRVPSFVRVYEPGTRARPAFRQPEDVARWWVRTVAQGTLVALKPWPRLATDRRDPRLHRLFLVAYSPPGQPAVEDRLGMFITAFRETYHGRWRLLEATAEP